MTDRLCARTPVADELLDGIGDEAFCRWIIGRVVHTPEIDQRASHRAPITVHAPTVLTLTVGASVVGPGYAKVVAAHPIRPFEGVEEQALTYVCVCYQPLGPGEAATDASVI